MVETFNLIVDQIVKQYQLEKSNLLSEHNQQKYYVETVISDLLKQVQFVYNVCENIFSYEDYYDKFTYHDTMIVADGIIHSLQTIEHCSGFNNPLKKQFIIKTIERQIDRLCELKLRQQY